MNSAKVILLRAVQVPSVNLWAAAGLELKDSLDGSMAKEALKKRHGPFTPGLRIFWESSPSSIIVVGIDAMEFYVEDDDKAPRAGVVSCDPMRSQDVHELDGALRGELTRMGLWTETKDYQWRIWYQTQGSKNG